MSAKECSVESCDKPVQAKGLCNAHYIRWRRHGDPTFVPKRERLVPERGPARFPGKCCQYRNWEYESRNTEMRRLARLAARRATPERVQAVQEAKARVAEAKQILDDHLARCPIANAPECGEAR